MQVPDRLADIARWLRYAEEDLITAETLLQQPHLPPRQSCWYAQQSTEKALKAVLIFLEIDFPRTTVIMQGKIYNSLGNIKPITLRMKICFHFHKHNTV